MTPLTRKESKTAFHHILDNVLGYPDGSTLKEALRYDGIETIEDLVTITLPDIDTLTYEDSGKKGTRSPVPKGPRNVIRLFKYFVHYRQQSGPPISDWLAITADDFNNFRLHASVLSVSATQPPPSSASSAAPKYSPADLFKRGIKRDPSLFPTLKDEKYNDTWHRSFATQARAQDVSEVLDPTYKPSTQEQRDLFLEKQKYVYAVLESKVLTDRGKAFVREHETDFDAQAVYHKLTEHHLRSTKAQIDSSAILSYITSVRLGSGEWKGSTESFITHWLNQVRLYERQIDSADHFSDGQKRVMLENAVAPIQELRQVKNNADMERSKTGKSLTFDQYSNLLLSAASAYDNQFKTKREKRQVFNSYIIDDDYGSDDDADGYDIDAPVTVIQANAHDRRFKASFKPAARRINMPRDRWMSLSDKERQVWDQLGDNAKATILGISGSQQQQPSGHSKPPAPHNVRKVQSP